MKNTLRHCGRLLRLQGYVLAAAIVFLTASSCSLFRTPKDALFPLITPDGSVFENSMRVTLAFPEDNVEIRYTLDGSEPSASSPAYSAPLLLLETHAIRVAAFRNGALQGSISRATFTKQAPAVRPKRIILCIIDSMNRTMFDRLPLDNMNRLIANGVLIRSTENILPYASSPSPSGSYPWPLPASVSALAAGTVFLGTPDLGRHMIQNCFSDNTAFISNSNVYFRRKDESKYPCITDGYKITHNLLESEPGKETESSDKAVFEDAKRVIESYDPPLLSLYLNAVDHAASEDIKENRVIWDKDSEWYRTMVDTDRNLGNFLAWLEKKNYTQDTVMIITGNVGVNEKETHPLYDSDTTVMPTIISGPGVKKRKVLPYSESVDIMPTICWLSGLEYPQSCQGKVISEAFTGMPGTSLRPDQWLRKLNYVLCVHNELMKNPSTRDIQKSENAAFKKLCDSFIGIDKISSWHESRRSIAELAVRDDLIYKEMQAMVNSFSKPAKTPTKKKHH